MIFKRIEMQGFKSFADPVSVEFNDGITAVVGPNGSGKSNISDALRWVLGEQSPKALRGGQMSDVIFSGTESRKSRGMAEVTLVIDNSTGVLPIDFSEVAITRRMFRSGESEYAINNHPCRLRDIKELIMDTGIGVDGYSVIGQGKISDIVSGKPESRREIFEEAAGVVMYRSKKNEAEKKLSAASANLERANDIVRELEARIPSLMEDSEKAREYLELKERHKTLEVNITLGSVEDIELKNEYLKDDLNEAAAKVEEIKERKEEVDLETVARRERNAKLEVLISEATDRLLKAVDEINRASNKDQLDSEKLSALQRDDKRLEQEITELSEKLEKERKNASAMDENKAELDRKMKGLKDELSEKIARHTEAASELARAGAEVDEKRDRLFRLRKEAGDKEAEIRSIENMKEVLERRKSQLAEERRGGEERESGRLDRIKELQARKEAAEKSIAEGNAERAEAAKEYNEGVFREKDLAKRLEELRLKIGQDTARKRTLEELEANYEGYNNAVRFLMRAGLTGIHGTVAELISVPKGYETAIETALGGNLQNMVCDDDRSAQRAIARLKENRAGRLTFLPIGSIRGGMKRDQSLERERGFVGYAVDLIEFDGPYREIMENLLGRTAAFKTLDDAISASKGQHGNLRYVTLEGEIISASGAITGGAYRNKTANLLERKAEIDALSAKIDNETKEREELSKELSELRERLENLASESRKKSEEIRETELLLASLRSELGAAEGAAADELSAKERQERELKSIEEEQESSLEMVAGMKAEIASSLREATELETEIEEAIRAHEGLRERVSAMSEEITHARMAAGAAESEKLSLDAIVNRIQDEMDIIENDISRKKTEREQISERRERLLSEKSTSPEGLEKMQAEKEQLQRYIDEITEEKQTISRELTELTKEAEELSRDLEKYQDLKYEYQTKADRNDMQLENLKNKLWEEFEISYAQALEMRTDDFEMNAALRENRQIKSRIRELGDINVGSISEYDSVNERYKFLVAQRDDIQEAADGLKKLIDETDKTIKQRFKESFDVIAVNFGEVFSELFGGGKAELRIEDENDPLGSGIDIIAQPPGKRLQNINLLSGGEKAMVAIALMFAVLKANPTPFCILDEVEAPLDDANIERFANYLKKFSDIQFVLVTHKKATMEHADVLYGVTMPEKGISKLLSLRLGDTVSGLE